MLNINRKNYYKTQKIDIMLEKIEKCLIDKTY